VTRPPSSHGFFLLVLAALLPAAAPAHAQWSGSLTLTSDDRFRGLSRSDGDPTVRAALAFDAPDGWYVGGSLGRVALWPEDRRWQASAYGGHSQRLSAALAWELGVNSVHFAGASSYDYTELYGGLLGERVQARLYLSPDYFGRDAKSAYAELNARWPVTDAVQLLGHAGWLAVSHNEYGRKQRADLRLGAAWSLRSMEWQLAWSGAGRGGPYPLAFGGRRSGWSLSLSLFF
jgi:uncharacterized protein (TIGR02001 family)